MTIEEYQIKEQCILNDTIKAIQNALVDRWNITYIENIDRTESERLFCH